MLNCWKRCAAATVIFLLGGGFGTARAAHASGQMAAERKEIRDFVLTTEKLDKYEASANAESKLMKSDPGLKKQLDEESMDTEGSTVAGSVKNIQKHPTLVSAIQSSGLSIHDYVVMTYTLINSSSAVAMKKSGAIKEYPANVSPGNAAFTEQNFDRIKKMLNSMSGDSDGDDQ
jgi:hypothetical protein